MGEKSEFNGYRDLFNRINKSDGFLGFYRGFGMLVFNLILHTRLELGLTDMGKYYMFPEINKENRRKYLFYSISVALFANIAIYPIEVINRH